MNALKQDKERNMDIKNAHQTRVNIGPDGVAIYTN